MRNFLKKATLGITLGAAALTTAVPAQAQYYRNYDRYDRHRGNGGAAIVAGIAGLAIGAALTSRNRYDPRYRYDYSYYDQRGYFPNDGYYARNYYNRYRGYDNCYTRRVYDPYIGRRVPVRYCNGW
jgi:hypothetical protein